jgi:hypothetical protein
VIRVNLIRGQEAPLAPRFAARQVPFYLLGVALLGALPMALNWRATALIEVRDALRLEIARHQSAMVRRRSGESPAVDDVDDPAGSRAAGVRLRSAAAAVPPDLWLIAYSERGGNVTIRGMAASDDAPRTFLENLAATSAFGRVEITETARRSPPEAEPTQRTVHEFLLRAVRKRAGPVDDEGKG